MARARKHLAKRTFDAASDGYTASSSLAGTVEVVTDSDRRVPGDPPADPETWTDDEWIAWLEATDAAEGAPTRPARPRWTERRPASALGAAMLGLHDVIYGKQEEAGVVVDAGGDPPRDDVPDVHLDPEHSEAVVRHRQRPHPGG